MADHPTGIGPPPALRDAPHAVWHIYAGLVTLYQVFLEPLLCHLRLTTPGRGDPTYGRAALPIAPRERALIHDNPDVAVQRHRLVLRADAMRRGGSWDREGSHWVEYQVWQWAGAPRKQYEADIMLLHGINNYGGRACGTGLHLVQAGFRVIAIDLPSFGRSTGLHAYVPSMRLNVEAAHAVLCDVARRDREQGRGSRKVFLQGESMGGFTALYYAAIYPPISPPSQGGPARSTGDKLLQAGAVDAGSDERPRLAGVAVAAPMIAISPHSRPSKFVEQIARLIIFFAGRLPFAAGVKGNVSDDIRVEQEFQADKHTYKGHLRIATGMAILAGLAELQELAPRITCPVTMHHGANDRATDWRGTQAFFDRLPSQDKRIKIWDGYEHIMMKSVQGMSEADHKKRMAVLDDITGWFVEQSTKDTA